MSQLDSSPARFLRFVVRFSFVFRFDSSTDGPVFTSGSSVKAPELKSGRRSAPIKCDRRVTASSRRPKRSSAYRAFKEFGGSTGGRAFGYSFTRTFQQSFFRLEILLEGFLYLFEFGVLELNLELLMLSFSSFSILICSFSGLIFSTCSFSGLNFSMFFSGLIFSISFCSTFSSFSILTCSFSGLIFSTCSFSGLSFRPAPSPA